MRLDIVSCGRKSQPAQYSNKFIEYRQNYLIIVQKGQLSIACRDESGQTKSYLIRSREFCTFAPGLRLDLHTAEQGYQGHYIELDPAQQYWSRMFYKGSCDTSMQQCINMLEEELATRPQQLALDVLYELLATRAIQQQRMNERGTNLSDDQDLVESVESVIRAHLHSDLRIEELFTKFPLGLRQIRRRYRAICGKSLKAIQLEMKMKEAERMLKESEESITNIAYELGFPSSQHFSKMFKQSTGFTPRQFRIKPAE